MDSFKAAAFGNSAVGALGPMKPSVGLFGSSGSFGLTQTLQTTSSLTGLAGSFYGAYGSVQAAKQEQSQFNMQANSQELQADAIKLQAVEKGNILRRQLLQDIGSANASAAARGIDVGSGSARQIAIQSIGETERDIAKIESGANIDAAGSRTSAARSRAQGANAIFSGNVRAARGLTSYLSELV